MTSYIPEPELPERVTYLPPIVWREQTEKKMVWRGTITRSHPRECFGVLYNPEETPVPGKPYCLLIWQMGDFDLVHSFGWFADIALAKDWAELHVRRIDAGLGPATL